MKKNILTTISILFVGVVFAQEPSGYYDSSLGLTGDACRSELSNIISGHTSISYDNIWGYFNNTDVVSGIIEDVYSNTSYAVFSDQCGQYSAEGDCYNREHSVPQDWFNGVSPMYSDLFHIYPSDGYVNGQRSNLPFGEVGNATYTSANGSKKGNNTYPGYSGTVFEPADDLKGDMARTYFYMVTRYMGNVSGWTGESFSGNTLSSWTLNMMLEWHNSDPVSQKEIDRNNTIYNIQDNRNPYIDHPEWVDRVFVWSTGIETANSSEVIKCWYFDGVISLNNSIECNYELYNSIGEQIQVGSTTQQHIAVGNLSSGVYFFKVENQLLKLVVL